LLEKLRRGCFLRTGPRRLTLYYSDGPQAGDFYAPIPNDGYFDDFVHVLVGFGDFFENAVTRLTEDIMP